MNQTKKLHPAIAALIVVVLVGIVASVAVVITGNNKNKTIDSADTHDHSTHDHEHAVTDPSTSTESTDTSTYKDGTYSATGSYISPGGRESIGLTVTIKDGVITDTSIVNKATETEAEQHQKLFSNNYKILIVGKKIGDVSLSRVAGSSLTSNGFNNALNHIKDDAKV